MAEKEYIERDKAIDACFDGWNNNAHDCAENIRSIPTADVRPVARGRWIEFPAALTYKDEYCDTHIVCSACEAVFDIMDNDTERFYFCPNCGAMMGVSFDG